MNRVETQTRAAPRTWRARARAPPRTVFDDPPRDQGRGRGEQVIVRARRRRRSQARSARFCVSHARHASSRSVAAWRGPGGATPPACPAGVAGHLRAGGDSIGRIGWVGSGVMGSCGARRGRRAGAQPVPEAGPGAGAGRSGGSIGARRRAPPPDTRRPGLARQGGGRRLASVVDTN